MGGGGGRRRCSSLRVGILRSKISAAIHYVCSSYGKGASGVGGRDSFPPGDGIVTKIHTILLLIAPTRFASTGLFCCCLLLLDESTPLGPRCKVYRTNTKLCPGAISTITRQMKGCNRTTVVASRGVLSSFAGVPSPILQLPARIIVGPALL